MLIYIYITMALLFSSCLEIGKKAPLPNFTNSIKGHGPPIEKVFQQITKRSITSNEKKFYQQRKDNGFDYIQEIIRNYFYNSDYIFSQFGVYLRPKILDQILVSHQITYLTTFTDLLNYIRPYIKEKVWQGVKYMYSFINISNKIQLTDQLKKEIQSLELTPLELFFRWKNNKFFNTKDMVKDLYFHQFNKWPPPEKINYYISLCEQFGPWNLKLHFLHEIVDPQSHFTDVVYFEYFHHSVQTADQQLKNKTLKEALKTFIKSHVYNHIYEGYKDYIVTFNNQLIMQKSIDWPKVIENRIFTPYKEYLPQTKKIKKQYLKWIKSGNKSLRELSNYVVNKYGLNTPIIRQKLVLMTINNLLRREANSQEILDYEHFLESNYIWELEFEILKKYPQYQNIDWKKVPFWGDLEKSDHLVSINQSKLHIKWKGIPPPFNPTITSPSYSPDQVIMLYARGSHYSQLASQIHFGIMPYSRNQISGEIIPRLEKNTRLLIEEDSNDPGPETKKNPFILNVGSDIYLLYTDLKSSHHYQKDIFISKLGKSEGTYFMHKIRRIKWPSTLNNLGLDIGHWIPFSHDDNLYILYSIHDKNYIHENYYNIYIWKVNLNSSTAKVVYKHHFENNLYFSPMHFSTPLYPIQNAFMGIATTSKVIQWDDKNKTATFNFLIPFLIEDKPPFKIKAISKRLININHLLNFDQENFYTAPTTEHLMNPQGLVVHEDDTYVSIDLNQRTSSIVLFKTPLLLQMLKNL